MNQQTSLMGNFVKEENKKNDGASQTLFSGKFEAYKNCNGSQGGCPTTPHFVK